MSLPDELLSYVNRPDATYHWEPGELGRQERLELVTLTSITLTSQCWQGIAWTHVLEVFVPDTILNAQTALLAINANHWNHEASKLTGNLYAVMTGMVVAFLYDVPNQPLFEGKIEDELIAYTFVKALDTEEPDWPLLYPMTKSAVRAMDTVEAFLKAQGHTPPTKFVVGGTCKRGWTTWLTAAVNSRVAGILPMVYDNLNLFAQMPHQVEVFDKYSAQISDYTDVDLPGRMKTPGGQHLARVIDPYTYQERLTMPKLILNGSNDQYWATDALNLYWGGLVGPKHVLYVPNQGHGLNDPNRIDNASLAFIRAVASGTSLPDLQWQFSREGAEVQLTLTSDTPATGATLWIAVHNSLDFRSAVWEQVPLRSDAGEGTWFAGQVPVPKGRCLAAFGEIQFPLEGPRHYPLSTQMYLVDDRAAR